MTRSLFPLLLSSATLVVFAACTTPSADGVKPDPNTAATPPAPAASSSATRALRRWRPYTLKGLPPIPVCAEGVKIDDACETQGDKCVISGPTAADGTGTLTYVWCTEPKFDVPYP